MSGITDEMIKKKLTEALAEPAVPQALVEQNVVRAQAITAGREAEKRLETMPELADAAETVDLAAKSLVGRLMMTRKPPMGVTAPQMTDRLKSESGFVRLASGKPGEILHMIRSGELLQKLAGSARNAASPDAPKAAIRTPEPPKKTGPVL